ncbi:hypothetical protein SDC9_50928 [bioreactor metagenome]|uniref:Uncharacterized protein n=1 Tax=bioreactor metagenome TaxID=1076179 RepID=A0A644WM17_9ZZZZ
MIDGLIEVGNGLCLNALGSVNNEQCTFAGGDGARDFVGKVNVTRSVNQVQLVFLTTALTAHLDSMALDGYAFFALQIHVIKNLVLKLAFAHSSGEFEQPVCQR